MARKKPVPNVWELYADSIPPYLAERVIFGEHDVLESFVVPGIDADGNLFAEGYESEPVTHPRIRHWVDALRAFDKRGDKAPLVDLLKSHCELLPILHRSLTDLLFRHRLTKRRSVTRATIYERQVLALLDELEALRVSNQLHGKHSSEIRRELDDFMSLRKLLARLFSRYDFVRRGGKQFAAAYTMTSEDAVRHGEFAVADEEVRAYREQGYSPSRAVEKVAADYFPLHDDEKSAEFAEGLAAYHNKENGSSRRKEKRRKK